MFGQVTGRLMLDFHKVSVTIIFILFYDRDRQGEVFKVMTNASF